MRYTNWHLYLLYKFTPSLLTYLLWRIWLLCGYLEPFAYLLWAPMAMTRGFFDAMKSLNLDNSFSFQPHTYHQLCNILQLVCSVWLKFHYVDFPVTSSWHVSLIIPSTPENCKVAKYKLCNVTQPHNFGSLWTAFLVLTTKILNCRKFFCQAWQTWIWNSPTFQDLRARCILKSQTPDCKIRRQAAACLHVSIP